MKLKKITKFFNNKKPIVGLTAYSYDMAKVLDKHVDFILVGDSLGMTLYGMKNTRKVTLDMMINHGKAVVKAAKNTLVIIDLPFNTYERTPLQAYETACKVIEKTNCYGVKIEGGIEIKETISYLTKRGINVMGHIGLSPQSIKNYKNIKIKGFNSFEESNLIKDAISLCNSNVFAIVIEAVAEKASKAIVKKVREYNKKFIPTIGIGASQNCNGQILVTDDMLGLTNEYKKNKLPKFVKVYKENNIDLSIKLFCSEVRKGIFPSEEFCYVSNKKTNNNVTYIKFNEK
tara:strand:+ start:9047 stop:9910 length:864 start_codon:yes stop_codon:yes gene_type:complete